MRFTARQDIEAPIATVFAALSDFDRFERVALQRGAEVRRTGGGAGLAWTVNFRYRGRPRKLDTVLETFDPPSALVSTGRIGGFEGILDVRLVALSPRRTRLTVDLDLRARSLAARLLMPSIRLARTSLGQRFRRRLEGFAREIERTARG